MTFEKTNRRHVIRTVATGLAAAASVPVIAKEHGGAPSGSIATPASEAGICATCQFWGGVRRVSPDKSTVYSESLGWCNNSASPNFQKTTTPISGPMRMWKQWEALA